MKFNHVEGHTTCWMSRSFEIEFKNITRTFYQYNGCVRHSVIANAPPLIYSYVKDICKSMNMAMPLPSSQEEFELLNEYNCCKDHSTRLNDYKESNGEINLVTPLALSDTDGDGIWINENTGNESEIEPFMKLESAEQNYSFVTASIDAWSTGHSYWGRRSLNLQCFRQVCKCPSSTRWDRKRFFSSTPALSSCKT